MISRKNTNPTHSFVLDFPALGFSIFGLIAFGFFALSSPASADFYVGGQIGGMLGRADVNYADQNLQQNTTTHYRGLGMVYGINLGYLYKLKNQRMFFYIEGMYNAGSFKSQALGLTFQSNPGKPGVLNVKPSSSYGATLGLGAFLNPKFFMYVKVGGEHQSVKTTYTLPDQTGTTAGAKKSAWTLAPGLGFGYKMTDSLALSPEYSYILGRKYKILPQTTNADGTFSKSIYFIPGFHRVMLKLTYSF